MGTLTGAARVALGPELPPYYTDDETLAAEVARCAAAENDPLWRLPLWLRYDQNIDSKVADVNNVAAGGMAGSIICALFLKRFVSAAKSWLHFDIYAWTPSAKPGRPEGGECQAARALYALLKQRYGASPMFTTTKDKALLTTTTGALPRPTWYTANLRGMPLSQGFSQQAYREQHFDCLACHVAAQHRAGIDIFVDGDTRLDDDVAGRSWVSYATERIEGIGAPRVEVPPAGFMADKGPGDLMWEVIETRMTPPVTGKIGAAVAAARPRLQGDRADDRPAGQDRLDLGADSGADADRRALQGDRLQLLMDLSAALNREYHALADAGAPLVQIEEPAIHQVIADPNQKIRPEKWVEAFNAEVKGLRDKCEVWCHTCWGSPAAQRVASQDQSYKAALPYFDQLDVDVITVEGAFNNGMDLEHFGTMISQGQEDRARRHQPPHLAGRAARGDRRPDPPRAQAHRAGAADPDQRLRLRPAVGEPDARHLQDDRARARHQYRAQGARPAGGLHSRRRREAVDGAAGEGHDAAADFDPRITPARPDLAAAHLRGKVEAARFVEGTEQEVIVGLAPLRKDPSHDAPLLTEALCGERVTVYETDEEGWAWGQLKSDGYVGWLPAAALLAPGAAPTHKVAALRTLVFPGPSIKLPPTDALPLGAQVAVVARAGELRRHGGRRLRAEAPSRAARHDRAGFRRGGRAVSSACPISGAASRASASTARVWCRSR